MTDAILLLASFELTALLMVVLGIPLARRRVGPNALYGFRTPTTLGNAHIWYEVNALTGREMIGLGVVLAVVAALLAALGVPLFASAMINCAVLIVGALVLTVHGVLVSRKLSRDDVQN